MSGIFLASIVFVSTQTLFLGLPQTPMTETEVIMRNRNKQITLWLTEKEYAELKALVAKTNLSMQAYLRAVINGIQPKERVPMNLIETLKGIQRINNNLNQIALKAHTLNYIDADAYWNVVEDMESVKGKLLEVMYGE